uniref:MFS transporter n=1 Tax=Brachybacterium sp. GPGPB12 TaxID=3023517 RepID=UPI004049AE9E
MLAVGFVIGASSPQIGPFSRTRLVHLILTRLPVARRAKSLNATMGYESAADETAFVFGPVVVGLLATTLSPAAPMIGAALLTLVFVTAFAAHPTARASAPSSESPIERAPAAEPRTARVLVLVAGALGVGLFFGTVLTSLTAFLDTRGAGDSAGLVYGVMGVGSTILALSISLFPEAFRRSHRWLVFSALMLASMVAFGLAGGLWGLVGAMAVAGIGIGPTIVTIYSLAADRAPQGRSATLMSMLGSATIVGQSATSALTGAVADGVGAEAAMWLPTGAAAFVVVAALVNAALGDPRDAPRRPQPWRSGRAPWRSIRPSICEPALGPSPQRRHDPDDLNRLDDRDDQQKGGDDWIEPRACPRPRRDIPPPPTGARDAGARTSCATAPRSPAP